MQKYTIEEIIENRIAILCTSTEQAKKIATFNKEEIIEKDAYKIEVFIDNYNFYRNFFKLQNLAFKYIDFEQVDFEEDFILPEKWFIIVTEENLEVLDKWRKENAKECLHNDLLIGYSVVYKHPSDFSLFVPFDISYEDQYNYYKQISFEQFKKYVLKENNMKNIAEDWNIEVKTKDQFNEVCDFLAVREEYKLKKKPFYIGKGAGFNGGARFIRKMNNDRGFNYHHNRNEIYPIENTITWEQFKEIKTEKTMEKQIIGYRFKKEFDSKKYHNLYNIIIGSSGGSINTYPNDCVFMVNSLAEKFTKEAGVLDIWFETVYGNGLPSFGGAGTHKGKIINGEAVYGCTEQYRYKKRDLENMLIMMDTLKIIELKHSENITITKNNLENIIRVLNNV